MENNSNRSRFGGRLQSLRESGWLFLIIGLIAGLLIPALMRILGSDPEGFLENLVPEFIGIVFTVLIIDTLDKRRENILVRDQLLRQLHSYYNPFALQSIEELRVLGYLSDGSLNGLDLRGSDWRDGNLYEAVLVGADLRNASLYNADFARANLKDAQVTEEQLVTTKILWLCTMPDGSLYDGRYNLAHDFAVATRKGYDIRNPESMAAYYNVTTDAYLEGQRWAKQHLESLRARAGV
jgi:uncharacterized membrane protein YeaQ/YmgE (transglycosylase-associated protein family)